MVLKWSLHHKCRVNQSSHSIKNVTRVVSNHQKSWLESSHWPESRNYCYFIVIMTIEQGYSNGGPRSESGPLDGEVRTSSAAQSCNLHKSFIPIISLSCRAHV